MIKIVINSYLLAISTMELSKREEMIKSIEYCYRDATKEICLREMKKWKILCELNQRY